MAEIRSGKITPKKAVKKFSIPIGTIYYKLKRNPNKKPGRPGLLSADEEAIIVQNITKLCDFVTPISIFDVKMTIRDYIQETGRKFKTFINNVPSDKWVYSFLSRHPNLATFISFATNTKRNYRTIISNMDSGIDNNQLSQATNTTELKPKIQIKEEITIMDDTNTDYEQD